MATVLYAVSSWRGKDLPAFRAKRGEVETWCVYDEGDTRGLSDAEVTDVRPLVVLDLADAPGENVAPLLRATAENGIGPYYARRAVCNWVAGQIEAQTRPPKPKEPTGLGAVVKDREGNLWVRNGYRTHPWQTSACRGVQEYADIDAVEVLSDGVSP